MKSKNKKIRSENIHKSINQSVLHQNKYNNDLGFNLDDLINKTLNNNQNAKIQSHKIMLNNNDNSTTEHKVNIEINTNKLNNDQPTIISNNVNKEIKKSISINNQTNSSNDGINQNHTQVQVSTTNSNQILIDKPKDAVDDIVFKVLSAKKQIDNISVNSNTIPNIINQVQPINISSNIDHPKVIQTTIEQTTQQKISTNSNDSLITKSNITSNTVN